MLSYQILNPESVWNKTVTWILRIVTGLTFIFSGFVKGIDPWGTLYKVNDYLAALGLDLWPNLVLTGVFMLFSLEFLIGVFLLTGCFRRTAAIVAALFMSVMLVLTFWIAIKNPVDDCGCFGDAVILSNWTTFWKNVILIIFCVWLLKYNRSVICLINPSIQWIAFLVSGFYIVAIGLFGYVYQPLIDFRDYKVGQHLYDSDENISINEDEYIFVYEKDGVRKEFGVDDELPDENDGWNFVERKTVENREDRQSAVIQSRSFRIWDSDGDDVTEDILKDSGFQLILFMPTLRDVSIASTWQINSLHDWAKNNSIDMIAVVSGSDEEIANWDDLSMPSYPIYQADDTSIKEIVRGNPAVVLTKDGEIKWKSSLRALDNDDFLAPGTTQNPMSFARDDKRTLLNSSYLYLSVMAVMIVLSFLPALRSAYGRRKKNVIHDDKAHLEE